MKKVLAVLLFFVLLASVAYAASITLSWTAPADDPGLPTEGPATAYKLVWLGLPITEANFNTGVVVPTGTPKAPGQEETITISLEGTSHYYFAIKAVDASGNWSEISNVAQRDFMSPQPVADLR